MIKRVMLSGIGVIAVVAFGVVSFAQRITLVALAPIEVVDLAVANPAQTRVVGIISAGEEVAVLGCTDIKHYIAPQVRLLDGTRGFVLVGEFRLQRHSAWHLTHQTGAPLVFSC
jgi:hypothetical protein